MLININAYENNCFLKQKIYSEMTDIGLYFENQLRPLGSQMQRNHQKSLDHPLTITDVERCLSDIHAWLYE